MLEYVGCVILTLGYLSYPYAMGNPEKFALNGTNWETFHGIPDSIDKNKLEHFELNGVTFEPQFLLTVLEKCPNLKSIKISKAKWNGEFETAINLRFVNSFSLELPSSRPCRLLNMTEFKSLLFFIPTPPKMEIFKFQRGFDLIDISCSVVEEDLAGFMDEKPRPPETLVRISSGQELIFRNVHFDLLRHLGDEDFVIMSFEKSVVNINYLRKYQQLLVELTVLYPDNLRTSEELEDVVQVAEHVKDLELRVSIPKLQINLSRLDGWSLKSLIIFNENQSLIVYGGKAFLKLRHLEIGSSKFPTILNPTTIAPGLKTLRLVKTQFVGNGANFLKSLNALESFNAAEMEVDLSSLPTAHLQRLEFEPNVKVRQSLEVTHFPKIKSFKMDSSCEFGPRVVSSFSQTFKHARTVIISGTKHKLSPAFMFQILNTSATYFNFRFNRKAANLTVEQKTASLKLLEFGVPEDYSLNSIILTRESKYSQWTWSYAHFSSFETVLYYFYPISIAVISIFGIIGNVLNGIILFRKPIQSSTTVILVCLTLCDSILLWTSVNLIPYAFSNGFRHRHKLPPNVFPGDLILRQIEVFLFYPLRKTAYTASVYTTVLVTYERFIAVAFPLHAKRLISKKKSMTYCGIILGTSAVVNLPRWFESYSIKEEAKGDSHMSSVTLLSSQQYRQYYHGWTWTILIYILPVILIGTFNTTIYYKVKFANKQRVSISSTGGGRRNSGGGSGVDMNLTRMLVCLVLVFVILNLVTGVIVLYHTLFEFYIVSFYWDKEKDMSEIEVVACLPVLLNSSVNFIIYCAMGRKFREEFLKLIPSWLVCRGQIKNRQTHKETTRCAQSC